MVGHTDTTRRLTGVRAGVLGTSQFSRREIVPKRQSLLWLQGESEEEEKNKKVLRKNI